MKNYIILNGINSKSITGLCIDELPPITKAQVRNSVEEIDGRDGDIITKLGYGAYDKTVTVGLYGNYNVDDVISFFNSDGIVTFSNESDKYYNYQILNQINFEKLLRFKTASVTFHCQPFKYSLTDSTESYEINGDEAIEIYNNGNIYSKPKITIYGSGDIFVYLNDIQMFKIELGNEEYITIDIAEMEAYKDNLNMLKNRLITGNYDNFVLNPGENTLHFSGNVTKVDISNYSRWL